MHREHQTWRPFKLLYNSNKTKLFTVPSVSVRSWRLRKDRRLWTVYNKTWHFTNQFFHPFPLHQTQALLRIFNGSCGTRIMGKFQKRKGTREGLMWPWYLAPRLLQKISRSAWVWSSQFIWELTAKKLMSNGFSYDKDIFANVPSFGKFQARLLELHTKEP